MRTNWPVISVPGQTATCLVDAIDEMYAEKAAVKVRGKRANIRRVKRITLAMRRLAAALKRPPFLRLGNENKIGRLSVGNHSDHSINALA